MKAMVWLRAHGLPLPIVVMRGVENTRGKSKIRLYTCTLPPVVSDPKRARNFDFGSLDSGGRLCS